MQAKSSSLGRTGISLTSSSSRSWSSKDLLALAGTAEATKPRIQIATEKLHELFMALHTSEARENSEPYQPDAFLQALRYMHKFLLKDMNLLHIFNLLSLGVELTDIFFTFTDILLTN